MNVPSKKPPATPTVQLLTSPTFDSSPAAAAVGASRPPSLRGRVCASNGPTPTRKTESNETSNPGDRYRVPIIVPPRTTADGIIRGRSAPATDRFLLDTRINA